MTDIPVLAVRTIDFRLTPSAQRALDQRTAPLSIYLELLFSCLIRKKAYFIEEPHPDAVLLDAHSPLVKVWFRAVGAKVCAISDNTEQELETFPIKRVNAFIPHWVSLDYAKGQWASEFGYTTLS